MLSIIESGYVLPLLSEPPQSVQTNQFSARNNSVFVTNSVSELLASGCIRKVDQMPHVCCPLSVVENSSSKLRLVINLRFLNYFPNGSKNSNTKTFEQLC